MVFLQETMGASDTISPILESMFPGWHFQDVDVNGPSGGITLGYNSHLIKVNSTSGGIEFIGVDIYSTQLGSEIRILNVYGPDHNRDIF